MASVKDVSFSVKITGEISGEEFAGVFKVRPTLPFALQMEKDRLRREFLGQHAPGMAPDRIVNMANIFADLAVRITDAPRWWTESNGGMALEDDKVLKAVSDGSSEVQRKFYKELEDKAAKAKSELEAAPKTE
jgi:hypothetical protein